LLHEFDRGVDRDHSSSGLILIFCGGTCRPDTTTRWVILD
jgi:hypothetical protein